MIEERIPHRTASVIWPAVFYGDHCFAGATVIEVGESDWQISSIMPVREGMPLKLHVWAGRSHHDFIEIEQATVRWANGKHFGITIDRIHPDYEAAMARMKQRMGLLP